MDSTGVGTSIMAQVLFFPQYLFVLIPPGQEPIVVLTLWSLLAALFGLGLAIGVVIAVKLIISNKNEIIQMLQVGLLFFFQIRSILRNQTGDKIIQSIFFPCIVS